MSEFERLLDETLAVGMGDEYFQPWSKGLEVAHAALLAHHERALAVETASVRAAQSATRDREEALRQTDAALAEARAALAERDARIAHLQSSMNLRDEQIAELEAGLAYAMHTFAKDGALVDSRYADIVLMETANLLEREHEEAEKFRALEARAVTNGTLRVVINDTVMGLGAARKR